jgi:hypothetical protein
MLLCRLQAHLLDVHFLEFSRAQKSASMYRTSSGFHCPSLPLRGKQKIEKTSEAFITTVKRRTVSFKPFDSIFANPKISVSIDNAHP